MRRCRAAGLVAAALLAGAAAHASPVATLHAQGQITYWGDLPYGSRTGIFEISTSTPAASVAHTGTYEDGLGPYTGSYYAEARFGRARYFVSGSGFPSNRGGTQAAVVINDYFTVFGAPEGSTLRVAGGIHGTGNDSGGSSSAYVAAMGMGLAADTVGGCPNAGARLNGAIDRDCTSSVAVTNGTDYHFFMHLQGLVESDGPFQYLDFSSTAWVESVGVYDAAGRYVADAIIQTASGTTYGSPVPEPGSLALAGAAIAFAIAQTICRSPPITLAMRTPAGAAIRESLSSYKAASACTELVRMAGALWRLLCAMLILATGPASAASLGISYSVRGTQYLEGTQSLPGATQSDVVADSDSFSSLQQTGAGTRGDYGAFSTHARFGALGMALELSAHCYADGCGTQYMDTPLSNTSWFSDQLSLQNAPATGYLEMDYLLEGTWESFANGPGWTDQAMYLNLYVNAQNYNLAIHGAWADSFGHADSSGFFFQRNSVRVPYSSPLLGITLRLDGFARCESGSNGDCTASMMFGNTGQVGNFRVLDPAGNPVSGATILAESGHDYTQEIQAVPEPAVLSLTGLGLTLLCILRRR